MQELTIKQKLTNYCYFVIFNSILACVIGVGYWFQGHNNIYIPTPKLTDLLDITYIITTHFSIITLVVFAVSLLIYPTIYLKSKKATLIQFILFSLFLFILICDVRVFQCAQINIFAIEMDTFIDIINSQQAMFTMHKAIACTSILFFLWIIYKTQQWINKTNFLAKNKIGAKFTSLLLVSCFISLLDYKINTIEKQQRLLSYVQYFPINHKNNAVINMYKQVKYGKLQYPLKPLQTTKVTNPPNILIIAMDAWRADCFNEIDSPNLWQFAKQGTVFNNHFSGGNHTSLGLFSLFYGVPSIYIYRLWQNKIPSLLFSRLKHLDYQISFFTADPCIKHFTNDTQNLHIINNKDARLYLVDKQITDSWIHNYTNLNKSKPWLSFVFYDSLHGPDFPENYSTIATQGLLNYKKFANKVDKQGFINSYKTSVNYIDSLANKILQKLKDNNDLENTIVIITADHGCEWNDNNQGQWGYWSNFTDCQVKVPAAIILPKKFQQQLINQQVNLTTHYDIVPTLMKNFLGVTNDIADYSIGNNLLNSNKNMQEWSLVCSSRMYCSCASAIIENNKILEILPNGAINNLNNFNKLIFNNTINTKYLYQSLEYMTKFIKK